jgi:hypothetical protein
MFYLYHRRSDAGVILVKEGVTTISDILGQVGKRHGVPALNLSARIITNRGWKVLLPLDVVDKDIPLIYIINDRAKLPKTMWQTFLWWITLGNIDQNDLDNVNPTDVYHHSASLSFG